MIRSNVIASIIIINLAQVYLHVDYKKTKYGLENIFIKKPFEKSCDPVEVHTIEEYDQLNKTCPLPYKSHSKSTGCYCDYYTRTVKCFYVNRLGNIPEFVKHQESITWNVDLKCRNFTHFSSFNSLSSFKSINTLDLSSFESVWFLNKYCNVTNGSEELQLQHIIRVGKKFEKTKDSKTTTKIPINLSINSLKLNRNKIVKFYLTRAGFDLGDNATIKINSIDLSDNLIQNLDTTTNLDVCYFGIKELSLSLNRLEELDISYLIFNRYLNASYNNITAFTIDYLERNSNNNCDGVNLFNKTSQTFSSILTRLDFSHNDLVSLPFLYLRNIDFKRLEMLNVSYNLINTLNRNEFTKIESLKHLILKGNEISRVDQTAFHGLHQLKYLDLSENSLNTIPDHLFNHHSLKIETLYLSRNNLSELPKEALKYSSSVVYLDLSHNRIQKLVNYSFGYMYNLLELYLSNNQIADIEINAFYIDDKALVGPGLIEKLDLSNNLLTYLKSPVFFYLTNLRYLLLNNNLLKSIERETFYGVNFMITLDLNINNLTELGFLSNKNFSRLRYLKLAHNNLTSIEPGQFIHLSSLKLLDLSSNQIENISDCAFNGIENSVKKLILNFNSLTQINSCAFTIGFKNNRFVQILNNPINCSNSCDFFYSVYNPPYSINYVGYECSGNWTNLADCSIEHYQSIYLECKQRLIAKNCTKSSTKLYRHVAILTQLNDTKRNLDQDRLHFLAGFIINNCSFIKPIYIKFYVVLILISVIINFY